MKISLVQLRKIIKEEIDNLNHNSDSLDKELAIAIDSMDLIESRLPKRRNLREGTSEMIAATIAAIPLGVSLVKWGPSAWQSLKDKVTDWLDERYVKSQVRLTNRQIQKLFQELKNDRFLAQAMLSYREGRGYSATEIIREIEEIMKKYETLLAPEKVFSAFEKGEIPRIKDDSFNFIRPL